MNKINVVYTIDENFIPQTAASIASLCANNAKGSLSIFVLGEALSESSVSSLKEIADQFDNQLCEIPVEGFMGEFDGLDTLGWNEIILCRLLMARYLPKEVDRVLYLDGDTICLRSLTSVWESDLDNCILGAVIEPTVDRSRLATLGLKDSAYFNSGVLLIDLNKWRNEGIEGRIIDYCVDNKEQLFASDQDAINAVLKGRIKALPIAYNYCNSYKFYPYSFLKQLMGNIPYYDEAEYEECRKNPCIVHFLGEERPWRLGNSHQFRQQYEKYLSMTPYVGTDIEKGWTLYFALWNMFNTVMKPLPALRYRIITNFIPAFMKIRKHNRKK